MFQPSDIIRCVVKSIDEYKEACDVYFEIKDKSIKLVSHPPPPFLTPTNYIILLKKGLINMSECPAYYHNS